MRCVFYVEICILFVIGFFQIVLCFGIVIMVLGTYANLQAAEIDNISSKYKVEHNIEIMHDQFVHDNKMVKDVHVGNLNVKVPEGCYFFLNLLLFSCIFDVELLFF